MIRVIDRSMVVGVYTEMKKILVLGTGMPQADLIKACKARGMEVFACSYTSGDVAEPFADHFKQINIVDIDAIEAYARENQVDYIYSAGSDVAMPTVLTVSERMGLRHFCPSQTATICNNKPLLRNTLTQDFEGNIKSQRMTSADEELKVGFPLMMKPTDSQGQRGVYRVDSIEEFRGNFEKSMAFSREGAVIVEEFIEGEEISVNTFCSGGKMIFALPSKRIVWEDLPGGIIHRHVIPFQYADDPDVCAKVDSLVRRTLKKLNINDGPAYFQIIVTKDGTPKLVEVTPRLDGCHMWRLIRYSTGVDLLDLTVRLLLGEEVGIGEYEVKPYETEFLCLPTAEVFNKNRFEIGDPEFLQWYYEDGGIVKKMNGYMEKCGYLIKPYQA